MLWKRAGLFMMTLLFGVIACGSDLGPVSIPDKASAPLTIAEITTAVPIDIGALHNDAMRRLASRTRRAFNGSTEEFISQAQWAFNKALAGYGPSREVTSEEVAQAFNLLVVEIGPYFDIYLQDSTRLDPEVLLDHWTETGRITAEEHHEISAMIKGRAVQPLTDLVKNGLNLHTASTEYWYGKKPGPWLDACCCDECPPDKALLKSTIDLLGTIGGSLAGMGGIGGAVAGYLASNAYSIYENPTWLGGGAGVNGEMITGYGRGPVY